MQQLSAFCILSSAYLVVSSWVKDMVAMATTVSKADAVNRSILVTKLLFCLSVPLAEFTVNVVVIWFFDV
jgi:hypothetical protein